MKKYLFVGLLLVFLSLLIAACVKPEEFAEEPLITQVYFNKAQIQNRVEGFSITIEFQDGDGNIGTTEEFPEANAFVRDTRTDFVDSLSVENLEPDGNIKDISGIITFDFQSECCIAITGVTCTPDAEYPPTEDVIYEVFIKDRAGNVSNIVQAPPLKIICK